MNTSMMSNLWCTTELTDNKDMIYIRIKDADEEPPNYVLNMWAYEVYLKINKVI